MDIQIKIFKYTYIYVYVYVQMYMCIHMSCTYMYIYTFYWQYIVMKCRCAKIFPSHPYSLAFQVVHSSSTQTCFCFYNMHGYIYIGYWKDFVNYISKGIDLFWTLCESISFTIFPPPINYIHLKTFLPSDIMCNCYFYLCFYYCVPLGHTDYPFLFWTSCP